MLEGTGYTTRLDKDRLLKIKEHFARVRPRYAAFESKFIGVETEIFDSQIPGGMISNMESQLKQQGAGDRVKEVLAEVPAGPQGRRLPAAGHAVQPDRRHAGRLQRADGPLQGPHRRVRRPDARLLRRPPSARATRRSSKPPASTPRRSRSPAGPPTCSSPNGRSCARQALALKGCNGSDEDVLTYAMFPQVAAKFFASRAEGPKNLTKTPPEPAKAPSAAAAKPGDGKGPVTAPVTYQVKIGDKSHKVTVEPV